MWDKSWQILKKKRKKKEEKESKGNNEEKECEFNLGSEWKLEMYITHASVYGKKWK